MTRIKKVTLTKTNRINVAAAEAAFSIVFPLALLNEFGIEQRSPESCRIIGNGITHLDIHAQGGGDKFEVDITVSWPEGQDKHGSVEVCYADTKRKFACWKDKETGKVSVVEWSQPPLKYQYWLKFGIQWPEGKKVKHRLDDRALLTILYVVPLSMLILFSGLIFLGPVQEIPKEWAAMVAITIVSTTFTTWLVIVLGRISLEIREHEAWKRCKNVCHAQKEDEPNKTDD